MEHKIIHREINSLIFAEYNPRQLTKDQYQNLKDSISRFGLVDPIIVNSNKDRKNIIVGGHQRVKVAKDMDIEYVPVLEIDLTYEKERELNVRLNRNTGEWDFDVLSNNFEIEELQDWGFDDIDLKLFEDEENDEIFVEKDVPKEVYNSAWREWAKDVKFQYEILSKHNTSFSSITEGYAKIKFLNSLYKGKDYPRHCSLAFHNHQFITNGDLYSVYEGLDKVANGEIKAERLIFCSGDNPNLSNLVSGSLPFSGARMPLDFPAMLAKKIINKYAEGGKVIDPCFGWGGRMIGFLLSDAKYYFGIDVSDLQYKGVKKIKDAFMPFVDNKDVELKCSPFEEVEIKEKYNLAITSPPYFDVEKYIGGNQSHQLDNYDIWKEKFYTVLINNVYDCLLDGGVFALQVGSQRYPLLEDGKKIGIEKGFVYEGDFETDMKNHFKGTEEEKQERILILRKNYGKT